MQSIQTAANTIENADFLLFGAGAGMGVDSGLPDFRGDAGFWRAYPPFQKLGLSFADLANPKWFAKDPRLAWGFYGHRLNLYRATKPHSGFGILESWRERKSGFVFTSNVDGQFQRAGFEGVWEIHGSIAYLQCSVPCANEIWSAPIQGLQIDEKSFRAVGALPECPNCGAIARPNILMFGDSAWLSSFWDGQQRQLRAYLESVEMTRLTIIEMGAGTAIPSVRRFGEELQSRGATLVRINPRESEGPRGTISVALGAREALEAIDAALT